MLSRSVFLFLILWFCLLGTQGQQENDPELDIDNALDKLTIPEENKTDFDDYFDKLINPEENQTDLGDELFKMFNPEENQNNLNRTDNKKELDIIFKSAEKETKKKEFDFDQALDDILKDVQKETKISQTTPELSSDDFLKAEIEENFKNIDGILNDLFIKTDSENKCQSTDLPALKAELINSIRDILSLETQQNEQLEQLINKVFEKFEKSPNNGATSKNTESLITDTELDLCGPQEECVERSMCFSLVQLRSMKRCTHNQVCCHISKRIESTRPIVEHIKMPDCGYGNLTSLPSTSLQRPLESDEARFGEFPWTVALLRKEQIFTVTLNRYIGVGSLVAPNIVVTAAHKVFNISTNILIVRAGEWNCSNELETYAHQELSVKQIILHEQYFHDQNNIALLVLKKDFTPSPHISPICLPSAGLDIDYEHCIVTGWGKKNNNKLEYSSILKKVEVSVLSKSECNSKLREVVRPFYGLHKSLICAGGFQGKDTCFGDGGAPLVCPTKDKPNRYYQVGIVTWGVGCGLPDVPAVYTNVSFLMNWVNQKINNLGIEGTN